MSGWRKKQIEALKLALEVLIADVTPVDKFEEAIAAIKEALAQPEQEQQIETLKRCLFQMQEAAKDLVEQAKSLTPPQRTWVELTPEEIKKAWSQALADTEGEHDLPLNDFASLLQAKLKEKNT